ncbi:hypothetical protein [Absidia glauca]|uniref:Uncharacterized protein n=1 Tax=Absidia glauca TaxID=4829 RepID=A0A168PAD6_ABSGL|nr:hypothetical protein [Absidia glauca]
MGKGEREIYCLLAHREIIEKGTYSDRLPHVDHIILLISCYHYTSSVMFSPLVPEQTGVIRALPSPHLRAPIMCALQTVDSPKP